LFLGSILTTLELTPDAPETMNCGTCHACLDICPTRAFPAPFQLDARRCISYLTIELKGPIPGEFREALGNRIYGCDDCQLVCPWNKFARTAAHPDFKVRHELDRAQLTDLFAWTEAEFAERMRGSAIHRIGYERWTRNIAVALGNAPHSDLIRRSLLARRDQASALLREHIDWALERHPA
jgi:epoxyqueuosine reductase